jgi:hypothetical protein
MLSYFILYMLYIAPLHYYAAQGWLVLAGLVEHKFFLRPFALGQLYTTFQIYKLIFSLT